MRDYIQSPINLTRGHIDDVGDTRYIRLTQNVPDGFITELQEDLNALGFDEAGTPDGAFGRSTKTAVRLFQEAAHLDQNDGYVGDSVRWDVPLSYDAGTGPPLKYDRRTGTSDELLPFVKSRIQSGHPTIIRVDYAVDANLTYNHFVLGVGLTEDDHIILNDPATRRGDGYAEPSNENILQRTTRKQGYTLVQLDWYEPTG
jgi:peptidoglycan hydrolase-like protein with peptidoglycan-binding domain